jgi:hypothetical protein
MLECELWTSMIYVWRFDGTAMGVSFCDFDRLEFWRQGELESQLSLLYGIRTYLVQKV